MPDGDMTSGGRPAPGAHRRPGDGWVECGCGRRHWGLHGAAGLLLVRRDDAGRATDVVLQHRATWSDQGGTWGLPGGAREPDETAAQAALREAHEEAGVDAARVAVRGEHVLHHPDWSYTTVLADLPPDAHPGATPFEPAPTDAESIEVRWVPLDEVTDRELLPAFADAWPVLRARLEA